MIGVIIKTTWFYLLANLLVILRKPIILMELYYAGLSNERPTFRFSDKSKSDVLITVRIYKRLLLKLLKKKQPIVFLNAKSSSYIFDGTEYSINTRNTYITNLTGSVSGGFISKDNLIYRINFGLTIFFILCLSITFFPFFLLSFNRKFRILEVFKNPKGFFLTLALAIIIAQPVLGGPSWTGKNIIRLVLLGYPIIFYLILRHSELKYIYSKISLFFIFIFFIIWSFHPSYSTIGIFKFVYIEPLIK